MSNVPSVFVNARICSIVKMLQLESFVFFLGGGARVFGQLYLNCGERNQNVREDSGTSMIVYAIGN